MSRLMLRFTSRLRLTSTPRFTSMLRLKLAPTPADRLTLVRAIPRARCAPTSTAPASRAAVAAMVHVRSPDLNIFTLQLLRWGGHPLGQRDSPGVFRRNELERGVVVGGREVPCQLRREPRPGRVGRRGDDQPAWQRMRALLNPDLPVRAFLAEGVVLARGVVDLRGSHVHRAGDLVGALAIAPVEQVGQRQLEAVLVGEPVGQLAQRRGSRNRRVVVDSTGPDAEVGPIGEIEPLLLVAGDLGTQTVGTLDDHVDDARRRDVLAIVEDFVTARVGADLK